MEIFEKVPALSPLFGLRIVDRDDLFPRVWDDAKLRSIYNELTADVNDCDMLMESAGFEEVDDYYNPGTEEVDPDYILEAIVVDKFAKTERRMLAVVRVLNRHLKNTEIEALPAEVGKPKRTGSFAYVTVQIPFSDGQTVSVIFHSPEGDKRKITANDTIIAFRWLLNRRDITHVVAPEDGSEISLEELAIRVTKLVVKNSARFQRTQKDAMAEVKELEKTREAVKDAEAKEQALVDRIDASQKEAQRTEETLSALLSQLERQKAINAELQTKLNGMQKAEEERKPVKGAGAAGGEGAGQGEGNGEPKKNEYDEQKVVVFSLPKANPYRPELLRVAKASRDGKTFYLVETSRDGDNWITQKEHVSEQDAIADATQWYPEPDDSKPIKDVWKEMTFPDGERTVQYVVTNRTPVGGHVDGYRVSFTSKQSGTSTIGGTYCDDGSWTSNPDRARGVDIKYFSTVEEAEKVAREHAKQKGFEGADTQAFEDKAQNSGKEKADREKGNASPSEKTDYDAQFREAVIDAVAQTLKEDVGRRKQRITFDFASNRNEFLVGGYDATPSLMELKQKAGYNAFSMVTLTWNQLLAAYDKAGVERPSMNLPSKFKKPGKRALSGMAPVTFEGGHVGSCNGHMFDFEAYDDTYADNADSGMSDALKDGKYNPYEEITAGHISFRMANFDTEIVAAGRLPSRGGVREVVAYKKDTGDLPVFLPEPDFSYFMAKHRNARLWIISSSEKKTQGNRCYESPVLVTDTDKEGKKYMVGVIMPMKVDPEDLKRMQTKEDYSNIFKETVPGAPESVTPPNEEVVKPTTPDATGATPPPAKHGEGEKPGPEPAYVAEIQKIASGAYDDEGSDSVGKRLDSLAEQVEADGMMEKYEPMLNAAADHLTDLMEKEGM